MSNSGDVLWEQKLIESRVFSPQDFPITATRDYSQTAGFFYPTPGVARPGFPATYSTPVPYYAPPRPIMSATVQLPTATGQLTTTIRTVNKPMQPATDEVETVQNDNIPQYDGAMDIHFDCRPFGPTDCVVTLPQYDGGDSEKDGNDNADDDGEEETGSNAKRPRSEIPASIPSAVTTAVEPVDELGSDLDDEDELDGEVDDENIADLILCQYEKIGRVRTRWRGVLRAGIIHVNGSDFCFSRSNTDFDW
ncbi:Transcription initiation factor IIA large subunit [Paramicrosporidium saccamoebae]|uniref:Transcription initiation factor IIA large subunit n=1 Tax=Paramicrosporidium saccamoebae TaxID=1246581 RepID=A0A2H9TPD0_9FUNG|nr:Transcription initiation factor IIA large subunit [Paramicrosporidium saccamoebae]